eukprot:5193611-Pyramimonas_sp.AAC.1
MDPRRPKRCPKWPTTAPRRPDKRPTRPQKAPGALPGVPKGLPTGPPATPNRLHICILQVGADVRPEAPAHSQRGLPLFIVSPRFCPLLPFLLFLAIILPALA